MAVTSGLFAIAFYGFVLGFAVGTIVVAAMAARLIVAARIFRDAGATERD